LIIAPQFDSCSIIDWLCYHSFVFLCFPLVEDAKAGLVVDKAERLVAEAAAQGSQLVVFPEAFIGGYPRGNGFGAVIGSRSPKGKEDFRKYHASAIDVPGLLLRTAT